MFFIFCNTIAVNMNLGDQANLAALWRSLVCGDKKEKKKNQKAQKQKTCCLFQSDRGLELLLLQRPLPPACSVLIQFAGCWTALRLLCPQLSVMVCIAYHFTFSHVWPCRFLLLLFSVFSWDNRPQCSSLWPRLARPLHLAQWLG